MQESPGSKPGQDKEGVLDEAKFELVLEGDR